MEMIHQLREFRLKNNIKKSLELELNLSHLDLTTLTLLSNHQNKINDLLMKLVNSKIVSFNETMKNVSSLPTNNFFIEVDNSKFFDRETELKELKLKLEDLKNELKRSEKILTNKNFLAKAAKDKVNQEEEKFRDYQIQFDLIKEKIKLLEK
jgi:valyl-tRNA synthetase